ncbi:hypothetical protein PG994_003460 [Apiospora phragmitis]|uniref:Uncharacterized protein n=1 Tax=Apiospora phragmitis TaxID=2905665 RepID=A0ABR1W237_9PEZI
MAFDLRFWDRWIKSSSYGAYHQIIDLVLDEAVFWCTVVILITSTAGILGFQLAASSQTSESSDDKNNAALLALLWQALLQLLANYCTVVPVLREQRQRKKAHGRHHDHAVIRVHYAVFYGCVVASVVATVLAPVLLRALPTENPASSIANFASNIFAAVAASQLAAGITSGLRSRE